PQARPSSSGPWKPQNARSFTIQIAMIHANAANVRFSGRPGATEKTWKPSARIASSANVRIARSMAGAIVAIADFRLQIADLPPGLQVSFLAVVAPWLPRCSSLRASFHRRELALDVGVVGRGGGMRADRVGGRRFGFAARHALLHALEGRERAP